MNKKIIFTGIALLFCNPCHSAYIENHHHFPQGELLFRPVVKHTWYKSETVFHPLTSQGPGRRPVENLAQISTGESGRKENKSELLKKVLLLLIALWPAIVGSLLLCYIAYRERKTPTMAKTLPLGLWLVPIIMFAIVFWILCGIVGS